MWKVAWGIVLGLILWHFVLPIGLVVTAKLVGLKF